MLVKNNCITPDIIPIINYKKEHIPKILDLKELFSVLGKLDTNNEMIKKLKNNLNNVIENSGPYPLIDINLLCAFKKILIVGRKNFKGIMPTYTTGQKHFLATMKLLTCLVHYNYDKNKKRKKEKSLCEQELNICINNIDNINEVVLFTDYAYGLYISNNS